MAVWVTALERDGSDLFLEIFSLCGRRMRSWFRPMDEAMAAFGSSEGCSAIRFPGRIGWSRLLPHYEAKGSPGPGSAYFERRLS
jgi:hypothetical protein